MQYGEGESRVIYRDTQSFTVDDNEVADQHNKLTIMINIWTRIIKTESTSDKTDSREALPFEIMPFSVHVCAQFNFFERQRFTR